MHRWLPVIASASFLIVISAIAPAQEANLEGESPSTVSAPTPELGPCERLDIVSVPTPGEFLTAVEKHGKPAWSAQYREPIPTNFTKRAQIALNLGGLIADGYVAVAAQDGQQVKNTGRDIVALAKGLGVSQNVLTRGNSITSFAENNEWDALKQELEATQNELVQALDEQQDQQLASLVTIGAWLRGMELVSAIVNREYTPARAELLRQPELVGYMRHKLTKLSPKLTEGVLIKTVDEGLLEIQTIVSVDPSAPLAAEDVARLHDATSALVAALLLNPVAS